MRMYLLVDFGSTYTKLTAVDLDAADIVATSRSFTTVETDIHDGYHRALSQIYQKLGNEVVFEKIIACSSAAGGLKMAAIGLVEELTVEAAKRVCLSAGGKVDLVFSHYLTNKEIAEITTKKIDIVLLAGGTDGGNSECVIYNAEALGKSGIKIPIVYAGNKSCQDAIADIFEKYKLNYYICDNVMPKLNCLNIDSAKEVIRSIFMNNIIEAKGIKKIENEIDQIILPTPHAVLKATELLSKGYLHEKGFGEIVIVDIGGETTDVYLICSGSPKRADVILKGLEEPFAKRTVEGDLGMRYSAMGIVKNLSEEEINSYLEDGIDIVNEAQKRAMDVDMLPLTKEDEKIDVLLGEICTDIGMSRHVGKMDTQYTPLGTYYFQVGKDLTEVEYIIGTGGVIIYNNYPREILQKMMASEKNIMELRPKKAKFMLDKEYIFSAMGLLSMHEPLVALKIMKKYIINI